MVIDDGQTWCWVACCLMPTATGTREVPVLGDIPVLGNLFKSRSRERAKKNLMVFLRPVVMRCKTSCKQPDDGSIRVHAPASGRLVQARQERGDADQRRVPMLEPLQNSAQRPAPNVVQPLDDPERVAHGHVIPA